MNFYNWIINLLAFSFES
uniref:Uncharacterized protein n=1 Tax=Rhizophora mucronata TaxID=61149 RepID=A0A2P2JSV1_RHIMU